jgi:hypothetical protein
MLNYFNQSLCASEGGKAKSTIRYPTNKLAIVQGKFGEDKRVAVLHFTEFSFPRVFVTILATNNWLHCPLHSLM